MAALIPFIVLLVIGLIFSYIPMNGRLKQIGYFVIGIIALVLLLQLTGIV